MEPLSQTVLQEYLNLSNITNYVREEEVIDNDNSTEDCRFMSFEEWKRQKQADLGVDVEGVPAPPKEELSSFSSPASSQSKNSASESSSTAASSSLIEDIGRTYKDRFNYASRDCAATVVKTNSDAKGASAILTEVKDSYLLNKCSTPNKFVVIELCQDILVSSIVMGNFELFSSMFKEVRFSVSDRFPVTNGWKELGQFEARNIRDVQSFDIENALIWARYLKIEILSHYGSEFYCPISLVRVHGTTMMEEFKNHDDGSEIEEVTVSSASAIENASTMNKNLLNYTTNFSDDEECRVVLPHLALNEFLREYNNSKEFCYVPPHTEELMTVTAESSTVKTTQESILKNIVKRLSLLESNASLSLLYVEEQSKLLSDAFTNLERRHANRFDLLLRKFNETVHSQVLFLENAIEGIKNESNSLFHSQALNSGKRLHLLARELSFQRKVIIIDTIIILALLFYVIVARETFMTDDIFKRHDGRKKSTSMREFPVSTPRRSKQRKKNRR